jgi:predicted enzyme related to lactoylglutathione lyase
MIDGIAGILVYTSKERFAAMRHFYVDVLGLAPRSDRPGFINFEFGEQRLTVAVHSDVRDANRDPLHLMVNLAVSDIDAVYRSAVVRGAPSLRPPEKETWGGRIATLQDPDGNLIQLMQLP